MMDGPPLQGHTSSPLQVLSIPKVNRYSAIPYLVFFLCGWCPHPPGVAVVSFRPFPLRGYCQLVSKDPCVTDSVVSCPLQPVFVFSFYPFSFSPVTFFPTIFFHRINAQKVFFFPVSYHLERADTSPPHVALKSVPSRLYMPSSVPRSARTLQATNRPLFF